MTEYEMGYLLNEYTNSNQTILMNIFSMLSAFVIVSFLAAHRLSRTMVAISIALFTFGIWMEVLGMIGKVRQISALRSYIRQMFRESEKMSWHMVNQPSIIPSWFVDNIVTIYLGVGVLCYAAAIYFFFHCRHVNRKAETVVEAPNV